MIQIGGLNDHNDFSNEDLQGKDLNQARFINCTFDNANMQHVIATGVAFDGTCTFNGTDISDANFEDATNDTSKSRLKNILLNQAGCINNTTLPTGGVSNAHPC